MKAFAPDGAFKNQLYRWIIHPGMPQWGMPILALINIAVVVSLAFWAMVSPVGAIALIGITILSHLALTVWAKRIDLSDEGTTKVSWWLNALAAAGILASLLFPQFIVVTGTIWLITTLIGNIMFLVLWLEKNQKV